MMSESHSSDDVKKGCEDLALDCLYRRDWPRGSDPLSGVGFHSEAVRFSASRSWRIPVQISPVVPSKTLPILVANGDIAPLYGKSISFSEVSGISTRSLQIGDSVRQGR